MLTGDETVTSGDAFIDGYSILRDVKKVRGGSSVWTKLVPQTREPQNIIQRNRIYLQENFKQIFQIRLAHKRDQKNRTETNLTA